MKVVNHDVWWGGGVGADQDAAEVVFERDLLPGNGGLDVAVTEETEAEKWKGHGAREEDAPDRGGDRGKCIADAADDEILEEGGGADKGRSGGERGEITRGEELIRKLDDWEDGMGLIGGLVVFEEPWSLRRKGSARRAQVMAGKRPAWRRSWGARKRRKMQQSRVETCVRIMVNGARMGSGSLEKGRIDCGVNTDS